MVNALDDTLKHLPQTWELDSDDSSPAGTHVATASITLRATGAALTTPSGTPMRLTPRCYT